MAMHQLHRLVGTLRTPRRPALARGADVLAEAPAITEHVLIGLLLQSRMPAPPAALLVVGGDQAQEWEYRRLGYHVTMAEPTDLPPFAESRYDAVFLLAAAGVTSRLERDLAETLRPGGRLVAVVPASQAALTGRWRPVETVYAVCRNGDWLLSDRPEGLALLTREKAAD
jgi:hypothetical protein